MEHAWHRIGIWLFKVTLIIWWIQVLYVSHDLSQAKHCYFLIFNHFLYYGAWVHLLGHICLAETLENFLGNTALVYWNLVTTSNQVVSSFERVNEWLESKGKVGHLSIRQIKLLDIEQGS